MNELSGANENNTALPFLSVQNNRADAATAMLKRLVIPRLKVAN